MYVYASTEEVLWKGLIDTDLFEELKGGCYEEIPIHNGDILNLRADGNIVYSKFDYDFAFIIFLNSQRTK